MSGSMNPEGKPWCARSDPRMNRAVEARLQNPNLSLYECLCMGGFNYAADEAHSLDSENVTLTQRKNQLNRRLRSYRKRLSKAQEAKKQESSDGGQRTQGQAGTAKVSGQDQAEAIGGATAAIAAATGGAGPTGLHQDIISGLGTLGLAQPQQAQVQGQHPILSASAMSDHQDPQHPQGPTSAPVGLAIPREHPILSSIGGGSVSTAIQEAKDSSSDYDPTTGNATSTNNLITSLADALHQQVAVQATTSNLGGVHLPSPVPATISTTHFSSPTTTINQPTIHAPVPGATLNHQPPQSLADLLAATASAPTSTTSGGGVGGVGGGDGTSSNNTGAAQDLALSLLNNWEALTGQPRPSVSANQPVLPPQTSTTGPAGTVSNSMQAIYSSLPTSVTNAGAAGLGPLLQHQQQHPQLGLHHQPQQSAASSSGSLNLQGVEQLLHQATGATQTQGMATAAAATTSTQGGGQQGQQGLPAMLSESLIQLALQGQIPMNLLTNAVATTTTTTSSSVPPPASTTNMASVSAAGSNATAASAAADPRLEVALRLFDQEMQSMYERIMRTVGYGQEDVQTASQSYRNFIQVANQRENDRVQGLLSGMTTTIPGAGGLPTTTTTTTTSTSSSNTLGNRPNPPGAMGDSAHLTNL